MKFNVLDRTIYYTKHGSHAYGLNIETSDIDYKGICIKPKSYYLGFAYNFEQEEKMASKNNGVDSAIYSIDKFAKLAANCNPNIIEVLFVDESDIVKITAAGNDIRKIRHDFLSKKVLHTFSGYAHSQLKRIQLHRSWLLNPVEKKPERKDFKLPEISAISNSQLGAFESLKLKNKDLQMSDEVIELYNKEKQYQNALLRYNQFCEWKTSRNEKRAQLEKDFGYDTKHAMHLIRLLKMCKEILEDCTVNVKRKEDREELLSIRYGALKYDDVIELSEKLKSECEEAHKLSKLRNEPDIEYLNSVIADIVERFLDEE